mmetsp:Transcript_50612/g.107822  ORF Transcript_50612/g.107822 Transcript_50612/m.107822 type:complete len:202 (-) Transcript_50612:245-850(-)
MSSASAAPQARWPARRHPTTFHHLLPRQLPLVPEAHQPYKPRPVPRFQSHCAAPHWSVTNRIPVLLLHFLGVRQPAEINQDCLIGGQRCSLFLPHRRLLFQRFDNLTNLAQCFVSKVLAMPIWSVTFRDENMWQASPSHIFSAVHSRCSGGLDADQPCKNDNPTNQPQNQKTCISFEHCSHILLHLRCCRAHLAGPAHIAG